jgi:hypothetical protein
MQTRKYADQFRNGSAEFGVSNEMKTKMSYSECSIYVQGISMNCPLCGTLVEDGERHDCKKPYAEAPPVIEGQTKKKERKLRAKH